MIILKMYKDIWPFNILDLDATEIEIAEFPTKANKKSIVFFKEPVEIKCKNKILIVPFCGQGLSLTDIQEIENDMLKFAKNKEFSVGEENAFHILKTIKQYVYHGFTIL